MVGQQTLNLFMEVRILHPQPGEPELRGLFFFANRKLWDLFFGQIKAISGVYLPFSLSLYPISAWGLEWLSMAWGGR
jgi:hypothetical protein